MKVLHITNGSNTINDGLTRYFPTGLSQNTAGGGTGSEPAVSLYYPAGTISYLNVYVSSNAMSASSTFRIRKNTANGNSIVTIGAGTTGLFTDTSNTDTTTTADLIAYQLITGADAGTVSMVIENPTVTFDATTNTSIVYSTITTRTLTAGSTMYNLLSGNHNDEASSTSTTTMASKFNTAGTLKNFLVRIGTNAATTGNYTIKSYNVGSASVGNLIITVAPGTSGQFTDTSNSDSISAGDFWCLQRINGGDASVNIDLAVTNFETTGEISQIIGGRGNGGATIASNSTFYSTINPGWVYKSATEAPTQTVVRADYDITDFYTNITVNNVSASSTYSLRVNGASSALSITIGASTTGQFTDTDVVSVVDGDTINTQMVTGATGTSMTIRSTTMTLESPATSTFIPIVSFF